LYCTQAAKKGARERAFAIAAQRCERDPGGSLLRGRKQKNGDCGEDCGTVVSGERRWGFGHVTDASGGAVIKIFALGIVSMHRLFDSSEEAL
jgi:hypothetical protein